MGNFVYEIVLFVSEVCRGSAGDLWMKIGPVSPHSKYVRDRYPHISGGIMIHLFVYVLSCVCVCVCVCVC